VAANDVLFCADAVFPQETIEKHKILFSVDLDDTLETLADLPNRPYGGFAPGHGPAYGEKESIETICNANRDRLEEVREGVYDVLRQPQETSSLVQGMARRFHLEITRPTAYFLTRTTILAALSSLEAAGQVAPRTEDNRLQWQRK
jgi:glyoxylase-like metal-dependent hydrolase (beta-lactamase superfamily II)